MRLHDSIRNLLLSAYEEALKSPDPSTQVGAILISKGVRVFGHNHVAYGFTDLDLTRFGEKAVMIEHAERSAIYRAARLGITTDNSLLVAPWASCIECARAITTAGVGTVIRHAEAMDKTPERWQESISIADEIMRAGGVQILEWTGYLGATPVRFDGKEWAP